MEKIESDYIRSTSISHRKKFGQFYTPRIIANFMLDWILESNPQIIYDPAFGLGKFLTSAIKHNFKGLFLGSEVDINTYNYFSRIYPDLSTSIRNEDYFSSWNPNSYDAVICNPPYLRFQKFTNKDDILNVIYSYTNIRLSGYTNISSAFLIKSIYELKENGRLAYIMPLEFLNTGYGEEIKNFLLDNGSIINIIKLEDEENVFNEVITTIGIIFFVKNKESKKIIFSKISNCLNINNTPIREILYEEISCKNKWDTYFTNIEICNSENNDFIPITQYGKFKRGIATGDNNYFTLKKSEIKKYKLKQKYFKLCVSKSRQIKTSIFSDQNLNELIASDEQIFLLNINKTLLNDFNLVKYLELGEANKTNEKYLTKNRTPWYSIENREVSQLWFGVFSRNFFKIIRNYTSAVTLTCYHCFYPHPLFKEYIDRIFIFLKSKFAYNFISYNKRVYGDGLLKFEPNDLNSILVPSTKLLEKFSDAFIETQLENIKAFNCLSSEGEEHIERLLK